MSGDDPTLLAKGSEQVPFRPEKLDLSLTRAGENRLKRWLLLTGPRMVVTLALLSLVFGTLVLLGVVWPLELRDLLTETNAAKTLFSSLLSGAILLTSIVVSINSIVLSEEITDIENQKERIAASIEYRQHIEQFIEAEVSPARPSEFLMAVLYALSRHTTDLKRTAAESSDEEFRALVEEFVGEVEREIETTRSRLEDKRIGSFSVLLAGLNFDNSSLLHAARSIKRKYGEQLDDDSREALDGFIETLQHIATAREYFKSLYYKRELARLSARLLYVALPVIVFTSYVILALDARLFPEIQFLWMSPLHLSFIFAFTVALTPYVVLTAYVIRASTVTLRTLAAGPFILQSGSEIETFDWVETEGSRDWDAIREAPGD